ncbi:RHS repeat domain-containing protein, partial [Halocola ammonii]
EERPLDAFGKNLEVIKGKSVAPQKSDVNYFTGGSLMPGMSFNETSYDFGFNGMLKDDEIAGSGNSYDFGSRMYDPRIMRWWKVDPQASEYPYASPYNAFGNNPILFVDPDGEAIYVYWHGMMRLYIPGMKPPTDDEFAARVINSLNEVHSTEVGAEVINGLVNNYDQVLDIRPGGRSLYGAGFGILDQKRENQFKKLVASGKYRSAGNLIDGTMIFNINMPIGEEVYEDDKDGVDFNFTTVLAHELWHGHQAMTLGGESYVALFTHTENFVPFSEIQAVGFENYFRFKFYGENDVRFLYTTPKGGAGLIDNYYEYGWGYLSKSSIPGIEFDVDGAIYNYWRYGTVEESEESLMQKYGGKQ